jgi:phosphoribosyl-ATP pyrophosphohydrolase/phosphoribosyl-AMP cyclohydrolase
LTAIDPKVDNLGMALPEPAWDDRGLVAAVVQDADTGAVLMVAWMNAEAWELTRASGEVHFYSRSRASLWKKGETSGNVLSVVELRVDCDSDTILVKARPAGPTCHTGATACFFHTEDGDDDGAPPAHIVDKLERVLQARRDSAAEKSYTKSLLEKGMPKILEKIAEEHGELAAELPDGARDKVVHETADLLFHVMVGLVARDIPVAEVWRELGRRFGTSGHVEKASRPPKSE